MNFTETPLMGAFVIEPDIFRDERGYFSQVYLRNEFARFGLETEFIQWSVSQNEQRGTLRGMHFQASPFEQAKLVQCLRGALFDVIVDLRPTSPTYRNWFGVELSERNGNTLFIPKGFAHGFITLEPDSLIYYHLSHVYTPEQQRGIRWNDPLLNIHWPIEPTCVSDRDRNYPLIGSSN